MSLLNHPLDKIYRKIQFSMLEGFKKNIISKKQRLVVLNPNEKPAGNRVLEMFKKKPKPEELDYFLVTVETKIDDIEQPVFVKNKLLNRSVKLQIRYQLLCPDGNEETVARALYQSSQPGKAVQEDVEKWTLEFEELLREKDTSLLKTYTTQQEPLVRYLVSKLNDTYGLSATITIALPKTDGPSVIEFTIEEFPIRLDDFDYDFSISISTELKFDPDRQMEAITTDYTLDDLKKTVREEIQKISTGMTLSQLIDHLEKDTDSVWLTPLNNVLVSHGRKITRIAITPAANFRQIISQTFSCQQNKFTAITLDNQVEVNFNISYNAASIKNQVSQAIKALLPGDPVSNLNKKINSFIERNIQEAYNKGLEFIDNIDTIRKKLEADLIHYFKIDCGLDVHLVVSVSGKGSLLPVKIDSKQFGVVFTDVNDETSIGFSAELEVDSSYEYRAMLIKQDPLLLEEATTKRIKQYLSKKSTIHEIYFNQPELGKVLTDEINNDLRHFGRKINYIKIRPKEALQAVTNFVHNHTVSCIIKNYPNPVSVGNNMILSLSNTGRFISSGIDNFTTWLDKLLANKIQHYFFDKPYVDIATKLDEYKPVLINNIKEEVEKIGYIIQQHIVLPSLPLLKLKEGFNIVREDEFYTSDTSGLKVKLRLIISGDIPNLKDIEHLLNNPDVDVNKVENTIYEAARDRIESDLHKVSLQEFYLNFPTVSVELTKLIYERFSYREGTVSSSASSYFGIRNLKVTINPIDTDLIKRYKALQRERPSIKFDLFSWGDLATGKKTCYSVQYSIKKVSPKGWYIFQIKSQFTLEDQVSDISRLLEDQLKAKMETVDVYVLQYENQEEYKLILNRIVEPTTEKISKECGVEIEIVTFKREMTEDDDKEILALSKIKDNEINTTLTTDNIIRENSTEQLQTLLKQKDDILRLGDGEEDTKALDYVNKQIKKIAGNETPTRFEPGTKKEKPKKRSGDRKNLDVFSLNDPGKPKLLEDDKSV